MKIPPKFLLTTSLLILTTTLFVNGATLKLSDFTTPDDGLDDSPGFQTAIDQLKLAGGGTILVDTGTWDFSSPLNFTTYGNYVSFRVQGDKGAIIRPHLGAWNVLFYPGNTNQFELDDLIVIGDPAAEYDALFIAGGGYTSQFTVRGCQFYGLSAKDSLIYIGAAMDAVLDGNMFGGNAAGVAAIHAIDYRGLTVRNTEFVDYANFKDMYLSKTPNNSGNWIKAESTGPTVSPNASGQRIVRLEDIRFDEGAPQAVVIVNASNVMASGLLINVSGTDAGAGVVLDNVEYGEVKMSRFGYARFARPAVVVKNGSDVFLNGVTVGGAVYYGDMDASSKVVFEKRLCTSCSMKPIASRTLKR